MAHSSIVAKNGDNESTEIKKLSRSEFFSKLTIFSTSKCIQLLDSAQKILPSQIGAL